jgi:membrane dipeptidase
VTTRQSKPYTGYRSFQYLEPGVDYQPFRLAREVGRVEPYVVPVSPEQERTVQEILDEELVISLHDHPFVTPEDADEIVAYNR